MRFKLDENLPLDLAESLSNRGHDMDTVADEGLAGADDEAVLAAAAHEQRMIITLDRGFGDIRLHPPGSHAGVIVLRPISQDPESLGWLVERLVMDHDLNDFERCVVVVEPERVRVRRRPR